LALNHPGFLLFIQYIRSHFPPMPHLFTYLWTSREDAHMQKVTDFLRDRQLWVLRRGFRRRYVVGAVVLMSKSRRAASHVQMRSGGITALFWGLSTEYTTITDKFRWECGAGHQFEMRPNNVQSRQWCPKCSKYGRKSTISEMRQIAIGRRGKYLSGK